MIGALVECGALQYASNLLNTHIHNVYIYGGIIGLASSFIDNIPFVMVGLNLFEQAPSGSTTEFMENGTYWQLLSFCSALGGSLLYLGTLAGDAVAEVSNLTVSWYFKKILWRVLLAWLTGLAIFYFTHC